MQTTVGYRTILVGTDFSRLSMRAMGAAADIADLFEVKDIYLVHALLRNGVLEKEWSEARTAVSALELPLVHASVTREVIPGSPSHGLLERAEEAGADLLVIATHGRRAVARALLGSVASRIVRHSRRPVLVVGEGRWELSALKRILVAIDLSPVSRAVLAHAAAFAERSRATLEVLSIRERPLMAEIGSAAMTMPLLTPDEHRAAVEGVISGAALPPTVRIERAAPEGIPSEEILRRAKVTEAGLIVIGASGHNIIERAVLGSTVTKVLARAPCPVLAVPDRD